jgi:hypothetical protein
MHPFYALACVAALFIATQASGQEPVGCDKFKFPVEREMTALRAPDVKGVASGANVVAVPFAGTARLLPLSAANLPKAPERLPKSGTFSGFLSVSGISKGTYSISLSDAAWLDVIQQDRFLKPKAHSGVQGCEGVRKVVQFELGPEPFVVQISGAQADHLTIAIMPSE